MGFCRRHIWGHVLLPRLKLSRDSQVREISVILRRSDTRPSVNGIFFGFLRTKLVIFVSSGSELFVKSDIAGVREVI